MSSLELKSEAIQNHILLWVENNELKNELNKLKIQAAISSQKIDILNNVVADYTSKYKEIVSHNEQLELHCNFNQNLLQNQQEIESENNNLQQKIENMQLLMNKLENKNEFLFKENIKVMKQNKIYKDTINKKKTHLLQLKTVNFNYDTELNTVLHELKESKTTINTLEIEISQLKQKLQFKSLSDNSLEGIAKNIGSNNSTMHAYYSIGTAYMHTMNSLMPPPHYSTGISASTSSENLINSQNIMSVHNQSKNYCQNIKSPIKNISDIWIPLNHNVPLTDSSLGCWKAMLPLLCNIFVEKTCCSRIPRQIDLEGIIIKHGAIKSKCDGEISIYYKVFLRFCSWFEECCEIVKEFIYLWDVINLGCNLFCVREVSEMLLYKCPKGTFIVRLSSVINGGIVLSYVVSSDDNMNDKRINHVLFIRKETNKYELYSKNKVRRDGNSIPVLMSMSSVISATSRLKLLYTPNQLYPKQMFFE
eukprot:199498_1